MNIPMVTAITRRMLPSDLDAVARLEEDTFSDPWPRSAFQREIEAGPPGWPRVAVDGETGEFLGYMIAWFVADEAHLANVAVVPEARRRGVAQRLLDDLVGDARERGARFILLEVRRSNLGAQALYHRNGFTLFTVRRAYYRDNREDALVLIKPLTPEGHLPPPAGSR
jgi:ribosomal-protein-alanine N-acetyltransferase